MMPPITIMTKKNIFVFSSIHFITISFPNPAHSVWENYHRPRERLGDMPDHSPANCDWNTGILLCFIIFVKYLQKTERCGNMNEI